MRYQDVKRALALAASLVMLACSDAGAPGEPSNLATPQFDAASDAAKARRAELKQQLDSLKDLYKARREANHDSVKAARGEWKTWKADWKEQFKIMREAWKRANPGLHGGPEIQLLRCEPQDYSADAAIIGPNGGTLHMGAHQLTIPRGALDHEELIQAEAPTTSLVDVQLSPHGLQFLRPVELKLSYHDCVRPTEADFLIAYLGRGDRVLELPPSIDYKSSAEVEAEIDHFSRYAIAW